MQGCHFKPCVPELPREYPPSLRLSGSRQRPFAAFAPKAVAGFRVASIYDKPAKSAHGNDYAGRLIGTDHFEAILRATIPIRTGHAPDHMKKFAADSQSFYIEQFITHLHALHQSDDQPVPANLQRSPLHAFQTRGRFRDAWRFYHGTRSEERRVG